MNTFTNALGETVDTLQYIEDWIIDLTPDDGSDWEPQRRAAFHTAEILLDEFTNGEAADHGITDLDKWLDFCDTSRRVWCLLDVYAVDYDDKAMVDLYDAYRESLWA